MVLPLISAFAVAHKIPLLVKVDCSGIVSRVVGLLHRRGFKGAYDRTYECVVSNTSNIMLVLYANRRFKIVKGDFKRAYYCAIR